MKRIVVLLAFVGCGHEGPRQEAAAAPRPGPGRAGCAVAVDGAQVTFEESRRGVALRFTTRAGNEDELRERVRAMAEQHNRMVASRAAEELLRTLTPPSLAEVEEIAGGARLVLTPMPGADNTKKQ